jgi:anti-anti-sigma factor
MAEGAHAEQLRCFLHALFVRMPRMSPAAFEVSGRAGSNSNVYILSVKGPITYASSAAFQEAVGAATGNRLILDLTEVPSIDSMTIGLLVRVFCSCNRSARKLAIVGMNQRIRNILQITGVDPLFDVYPTIPEAESALA